MFQADGITKTYQMGEVEVHALRGVDLDLYESEFVVLLGPSGSGKSTLLNILGGLDVPTTGTVYYKDHDLTAYKDLVLTRYRREHVGFVFQFYNLIPSLTARENVALVTEISTNPPLPKRHSNWWTLGIDWITSRHNCPVANSSGWQLPAPLPSAPMCCFAMNQLGHWI